MRKIWWAELDGEDGKSLVIEERYRGLEGDEDVRSWERSLAVCYLVLVRARYITAFAAVVHAFGVVSGAAVSLFDRRLSWTQ